MSKPFWKPSTVVVIALVAVGLGGAGALAGALLTPKPTVPSPGMVYETPVPLPDFTLTDQTGSPYHFATARGKVVLMAFLFTHCRDVCPFTALKMRLALEQLGDQARDVELVVVSTDPERDTVPVVADYSKALGLYDRWHMVTGPIEAMSRLYKDLKITVIKSDEVEGSTKTATDLAVSLPQKDQVDSPVYGLTDEQILAGSKVAQKFSGGYDIAHSAPFWVVDAEGQLRTSLDVSASPAQLATAIKAYLKKG